MDIIAISFVRSAADVEAVREVTGPGGPWLMAKIETALAVEHLTGIVRASDAVMVARGDLGTELPIEDVPHLQKHIIRETVRNGKPVLVATQMLESMISAPKPDSRRGNRRRQRRAGSGQRGHAVGRNRHRP